MLTDSQKFIAIQKIKNNQFDLVYSTLPTPSFTAIRGEKDGDIYVFKVYRDGRIICEKL